MQAGQCVHQISTKFLKFFSDEHGFGSSGEYFEDTRNSIAST
jgi:hypothetical protein